MQSRFRQRGIATILIVVLLGFSLSATILAGLSQVRSSQELGVSLHSQTVTQKRAWSAAEALRQYLQQTADNHDDWTAFFAHFSPQIQAYPDIRMTGFEGLEARFTGVDFTDSEHLLFSANITATTAPDTRIATNSSLQLTFAIQPPTAGGAGPTGPPSRNVIHFHDGLDISGGINIHAVEGEEYDVFVEGNVNIGSVSLTGIDTIRSTHSIAYQDGSGGDFRELHASCDVRVANVGGFNIEAIRATNNVCIQNTASTSLIEANGFVTVAGGQHGGIWASANHEGVASCANGSARHCSGNTYGVNIEWSTPVRQVHTKGQIRAREATATVDRWRAEQQILLDGCPDQRADIVSRTGVQFPSWCSSRAVVNPQLRLPIPLVQPVLIEQAVFDANQLRDSAHYIYRRHNGATRVIIRNVRGIRDSNDPSNPPDVRENGYYHRSARDTSVNWNRMVANYACTTPVASMADRDNCRRLATAFNDTTALPTYSSSGWVLDGVHHAPGVVLLEGDVRITNGHYTNTFIATGSLQMVSSGNSIAAPNYIGPSSRTVAIPDSSSPSYQGVCSNSYGLAPADFCSGSSFDYSALGGLGNFALQAGSCPLGSPGSCSPAQYIGGNISIAGPVLGAIKAGNIFNTSGNTRVEGYVSALALGNAQGSTNRIGNRTVIDLRRLPPGYDPTAGAVEGGASEGGVKNDDTGTPGTVELKWSRYL